VPPGKEKMLLTTMWLTGLRVTEVIGIRKADINWGDDLMRVRWLKNRRYYERIMAIKPELKELLHLYTIKLKAEDRIFPISRQRVHQIIKKYDKKAHSHTFRHSFSVNCLKEGMSLPVLSRLLGHSDIKTTMQYLKIVPVDQAKELKEVSFV
jgi:integrase/recombinase XerD